MFILVFIHVKFYSYLDLTSVSKCFFIKYYYKLFTKRLSGGRGGGLKMFWFQTITSIGSLGNTNLENSRYVYDNNIC